MQLNPQGATDAMTKQAFTPAQQNQDPGYYAPIEVMGPDGNPILIQPNKGVGDPRVMDGLSPYEAPGAANTDRVQSTFTDANGNLMMVMRDGSVRESGHGVQNPFQITDVGGVPTAINRRTGQGIAISTPEQVGGNQATIDTVVANEADRRAAQQDLPQDMASAEQSLAAIDGLLNHPGFESRYGMSSVIPAIPGTVMSGAQSYVDQIGGQAFLQAFQSLKGGGQITEIEGQKATQHAPKRPGKPQAI